MTDPSKAPTSTAETAMPFDKLGLGLIFSGCATLFGALYMFGYWRPFGFDIFPHSSPADYISAPLNRLSVLAATPLLFALIVFGHRPVHSKLPFKWVGFYLIAMCGIAFVLQYWEAVNAFLSFKFNYENEKSVLAICLLLFLAGVVTAARAYQANGSLRTQVAALFLVLAADSMSTGYTDGKVIFNGTERVFFLENKELCDAKDVRDWVFIGKAGDRSFFMNTIDKRLCLTAERNYRLIPRKYAERL